MFDVYHCYNVNISIVTLDQKKAFDRVDHSYMFSALRAFGLADRFVSWLVLFYHNAQCLVKTRAGLSQISPEKIKELGKS